jgi:hypothetical protein
MSFIPQGPAENLSSCFFGLTRLQSPEQEFAKFVGQVQSAAVEFRQWHTTHYAWYAFVAFVLMMSCSVLLSLRIGKTAVDCVYRISLQGGFYYRYGRAIQALVFTMAGIAVLYSPHVIGPLVVQLAK